MSNKYLLFGIIVVVAVIADYVTKSVAEETLASQTRDWTHSIYRTVSDSESGLTMQQWAEQRLNVNPEQPEEARTLRAIYLSSEHDPNVRPRRLLPSAIVTEGQTLEIRYRAVNIVDGFWRHTYARNPGAAFGFLAGASQSFSRPFFLIVSTVALLIIISLLRGVPASNKALIVALAFITGGAIGNLIDRIMYGYVIDFIEWYVVIDGDEKIWPTFNVADSFISVGVTLMIGLLLFGKVDFEEDLEDDGESEPATEDEPAIKS
jgi:lipoprotein signal peptidase